MQQKQQQRQQQLLRSLHTPAAALGSPSRAAALPLPPPPPLFELQFRRTVCPQHDLSAPLPHRRLHPPVPHRLQLLRLQHRTAPQAPLPREQAMAMLYGYALCSMGIAAAPPCDGPARPSSSSLLLCLSCCCRCRTACSPWENRTEEYAVAC
eukprot:COSAG02_NODE_4848_length_4907_cov_7.395383_4_plen_152_part_00